MGGVGGPRVRDVGELAHGMEDGKCDTLYDVV